jgi:hypothetical protein
LNGPDLFTLTLSNLQPVRPGPADFLPPEGFTKFADAGVLIEELATRQQNVLGGSGGDSVGPPAGTPAARYGSPTQQP